MPDHRRQPDAWMRILKYGSYERATLVNTCNEDSINFARQQSMTVSAGGGLGKDSFQDVGLDRTGTDT